ncbi:MAG: PLDc N-terminal domain-containing protein [Patescibacteria group bacterium]|nr:PLDc N-terminal domain-containing protein [Patescibacteria group bacterium]
MKKTISLLTLLAGFMFIAQSAFAQCTLNGEVIPCDQMPKWPFVMMLLFFVFMMFMLAFWVWMLVDAIKNEKDNDLLVWILIIILLSFLGAILYYFIRKRKRNEQSEKNDNSKQLNN